MRLNKILKENIIEPYTVIADRYTQKHFVEPDFLKPLKQFVELVDGGAKILNAGCGPGGESKILSELGVEVIGIDIVPRMVEIARQRVAPAKFLVMDVRHLEFADQSFDGIWSARTLIHIPSEEIGDTLREWRRVLKEDGVVCICVLTGEGEIIEPEYYDTSGQTKTFFHYFSKREIQGDLENVGFAILDSYTLDIGKEEESHLFVFARKK